MARRRNRRSGPRSFFSFALTWLILSFFMPMYSLSGLLMSFGICGAVSYFIGRASGRKESREEEEARRAAQEAAKVKPQYTSQRTQQQQNQPQYTSQRAQQNKAQRKSYGPEIDPILEEGNKALSEMGRLYMSIKDPDVRIKINELMRVTDKITQDAIADPSDIPQIKKFLNYYLPTTIKLLNTYDRMSAQGIEGENLDKTMKSIDTMLDDAIAAFKKMLDSLFANQALDIETDIQVMNTMLQREGLTGSKDFEIKPAAASQEAAAQQVMQQ